MSDQAAHNALSRSLPADTPAWGRAVFEGLSRQLAETRDEVETLRRLIAPRLVTRKEAARIADCSTRTIQRDEKQGLIERAPTQHGNAVYAYADVVRLKRMMK